MINFQKANVVPIHEKGDKETIKHRWLVSLLPNCGKLFERLLCEVIFDIFSKSKLFSSNQFAFRPGDSCINQFLLFNHEILSAFHMRLKVCGILINICKVWHDGLVLK